MKEVGKIILFALLLTFGGCSEESDFSPADNTEETEDNNTSNNSSTGKLKSRIGPIEVPFTLNPKNPVVTTVVAEDETRIFTQQLQTDRASKVYSEVVHARTFEQTWVAENDITENFAVEEKGIVDILMIVDDSGSLQGVHAKLKDLLSTGNKKLLGGLADSSWQVAIADTQYDGCLLAVISESNLAEYATTIDTIANSANSEGNERALRKVRKVLPDMFANNNDCQGKLGPDWLRQKSLLVLIVITDEDHQCSYSGAPDSAGDNNTYQCHGIKFNRKFKSKILDTGKVASAQFFGIMDETDTCAVARARPDGNCYAEDNVCNFANPCFDKKDTHKYRSANFVKAGFTIKDINRNDYAGIFDAIAREVKQSIQDRFYLRAVPDTSKALSVKIDGSEVYTSHYTIDAENRILNFNGNSLATLTAGVSNPRVEISYTIKNAPDFVSEFVLVDNDNNGTNRIDMSTVVVMINGVEKTKDTDYSISGNTISLLGDEAAKKALFPEAATAVVSYRHKTEFYPPLVLEHLDIVDDSVSVHVGGSEVTAFTIGDITIKETDGEGVEQDVDRKTVVFNSGSEPAHEQDVEVAYTYYTSNKILAYDDNVADKYSVTSVSCSDESDAEVPCEHADGKIIFRAEHVEHDRSIKAVLQVEGLEDGQILVPDNLVKGTLLLSMSGRDDTCGEEKMVISDGIIDLTSAAAQAKCGFLHGWDLRTDSRHVSLTYQTFTPQQSIDVIHKDISSYIGRFVFKEVWEVYLNGVKKEKDKDYTIKDRTITLKGTIVPDTKGKVNVYLDPP